MIIFMVSSIYFKEAYQYKNKNDEAIFRWLYFVLIYIRMIGNQCHFIRILKNMQHERAL